jgi:hypothetical protein
MNDMIEFILWGLVWCVVLRFGLYVYLRIKNER